MAYTVREANSSRQHCHVAKLDRLLFSGDVPMQIDGAQHWLVWLRGEPVGFSSVRMLRGEPGVALRMRSGVLRPHRGHGLQRRLIRASQRWATSIGATSLLATVHLSIHHSAANMFRCGFEMYDPVWHWMDRGTVYWKWMVGTPTSMR